MGGRQGCASTRVGRQKRACRGSRHPASPCSPRVQVTLALEANATKAFGVHRAPQTPTALEANVYCPRGCTPNVYSLRPRPPRRLGHTVHLIRLLLLHPAPPVRR